MPDLGSDFSCYPDMSPTLKVVSGERCLAEHLASRLETPLGGLFYDPNYGTDLRAFVNQSGVTSYRIASAVESECAKDERVESVTVDVTIADTAITVFISVDPATESGLAEFEFTLNVSQLSVELLDFSKVA